MFNTCAWGAHASIRIREARRRHRVCAALSDAGLRMGDRGARVATHFFWAAQTQ